MLLGAVALMCTSNGEILPRTPAPSSPAHWPALTRTLRLGSSAKQAVAPYSDAAFLRVPSWQGLGARGSLPVSMGAHPMAPQSTRFTCLASGSPSQQSIHAEVKFDSPAACAAIWTHVNGDDSYQIAACTDGGPGGPGRDRRTQSVAPDRRGTLPSGHHRRLQS